MGKLQTYAPTPQTETLILFLLLVQAYDMLLSVADYKNAFCQSERLEMPQGRVFVEPCEGVPVKKGCLVKLIAPVYGLNNTPLFWHRTLMAHLVSLGCVLDPCLYFRHGKDRRVRDLTLIEVDDLAIGSFASDKLKQELTSRLNFGQWKERESEYAGRRIRQGPTRIFVTRRNTSWSMSTRS